MTTEAATIAKLRTQNAKLREKLRKSGGKVRELLRIKGELEECLARCRERGWDELSRVRLEAVA